MASVASFVTRERRVPIPRIQWNPEPDVKVPSGSDPLASPRRRHVIPVVERHGGGADDGDNLNHVDNHDTDENNNNVATSGAEASVSSSLGVSPCAFSFDSHAGGSETDTDASGTDASGDDDTGPSSAATTDDPDNALLSSPEGEPPLSSSEEFFDDDDDDLDDDEDASASPDVDWSNVSSMDSLHHVREEPMWSDVLTGPAATAQDAAEAPATAAEALEVATFMAAAGSASFVFPVQGYRVGKLSPLCKHTLRHADGSVAMRGFPLARWMEVEHHDADAEAHHHHHHGGGALYVHPLLMDAFVADRFRDAFYPNPHLLQVLDLDVWTVQPQSEAEWEPRRRYNFQWIHRVLRRPQAFHHGSVLLTLLEGFPLGTLHDQLHAPWVRDDPILAARALRRWTAQVIYWLQDMRTHFPSFRHNDLSTSNVLLRGDPGTSPLEWTVVVTDFDWATLDARDGPVRNIRAITTEDLCFSPTVDTEALDVYYFLNTLLVDSLDTLEDALVDAADQEADEAGPFHQAVDEAGRWRQGLMNLFTVGEACRDHDATIEEGESFLAMESCTCHPWVDTCRLQSRRFVDWCPTAPAVLAHWGIQQPDQVGYTPLVRREGALPWTSSWLWDYLRKVYSDVDDLIPELGTRTATATAKDA